AVVTYRDGAVAVVMQPDLKVASERRSELVVLNLTRDEDRFETGVVYHQGVKRERAGIGTGGHRIEVIHRPAVDDQRIEAARSAVECDRYGNAVGVQVHREGVVGEVNAVDHDGRRGSERLSRQFDAGACVDDLQIAVVLLKREVARDLSTE